MLHYPIQVIFKVIMLKLHPFKFVILVLKFKLQILSFFILHILYFNLHSKTLLILNYLKNGYFNFLKEDFEYLKCNYNLILKFIQCYFILIIWII